MLRDKFHMEHRKRVRRWRKNHEDRVYIKDAEGRYGWSARKESGPVEYFNHVKIGRLEE